MSAYAYHNIINQFQQLSPEDQARLLEDLAAIARGHQVKPEPEHTFQELRGLGKELWRSVDVDQYLEEERNSWDG
jgi:hypothetical protein